MGRGGLVVSAFDFLGVGETIGEFEGGFKAVSQAGFQIGFDDDPVHNHFHVVAGLAVQFRGFGDFVKLTVDFDAGEALAGQLCEFAFAVAFPITDDRGEKHQAHALRERHDPVHHLADGLGFDGQASSRRIGNTHARPEQTHIVVDLRDRADGRAGILGGGFLLDRDGGGEPFDGVHVWFAHQFEELAGVGREAFNVAALAFCVDCIERERRFPRAGQARDDRERVTRDCDVDILEVVGACATDTDRMIVWKAHEDPGMCRKGNCVRNAPERC